MTLSSLLMLLLQLCSLQLMVVSKPTCPMQGHLVQDAHDLLQDLGADFPVHCLPYNTNISFPCSAFPSETASQPQCRRVLWVMFTSLREAGLLFENHTLPTGEGGVNWDEKKLDDFQNMQYQLLNQGSCLSLSQPTGGGQPGALSLYFGNVESVLQENAACGWMALRRDLLSVLKFVLQKHRSCLTWRHARSG